jgi:hypothetical protein
LASGAWLGGGWFGLYYMQFVLDRKPIAVHPVLLATVCLIPSDDLVAWI